MAELSPRERLENLKTFINSKVGGNLDLTEGVRALASQSGGSKNLIPEYESYANTYIDDYGEKVEYSNWTSSEYIPIPEGYSYVVSNLKKRYNWLYTENKLPLKAVRFDQNQVQALTGAAKYIRVSDTTTIYKTAVLAFIE